MSLKHGNYSEKMLAKVEPHNYHCIIHDKMDQAKTWLPKIGGNQANVLMNIQCELL